MNVTPEKMEWKREGATVYMLMHHGWSKGVEQFRNRYWFRVYAGLTTGGDVEAEQVAAFIVKAVNAHDMMVEALRDVVINAAFNLSADVAAARAALAAAGEQV